MKQLYHSCCFCCSLKTGAIIVAVLHMLASGLMLLVDSLILDNFDHNFELTHSTGKEDDIMLYHIEKIMRFADLLFQVFLFGFSILLLLGALRGKPKLVLAWVIIESVCFAVYIAKDIACFGFQLGVSFSTVALRSVIAIYCLAAMTRFYQELKETKRMVINCDLKLPLDQHL